MFKVGLELPAEVVKEEKMKKKQRQQQKQQQEQQQINPVNLQKMLDELKQPEEKTIKDSNTQRTDKRLNSGENKKMKKQRIKEMMKEKKEMEKKVGKEEDAQEDKTVEEKIEKKVENKSEDKKEEKQKESSAQANNKRKAEESTRPAKKLTPLQLKMQQKLSGARFRWINEQLYTTESSHAFDIFQKQPEVFKEYHEGFRHQVEQWPENPVNSFVLQFQDRLVKPLNAPGGLPGDKQQNKVVVADMGCGEADLALQLQQKNTSRRGTRFEVHSFDMTAANERITVADIANVPLPNESCHVVVFCLALMGTNLVDFINEGIRVLANNGLVWIAEIKSRFEKNDYSSFVDTLKKMGLYHRTTDDSNKMFVKFEFVKLPHKMAKASETNPEIALKPCIYKRR